MCESLWGMSFVLVVGQHGLDGYSFIELVVDTAPGVIRHV